MSTVIGLVKEDQQAVNLAAKLEAIGLGFSKVKILTDPDEAQPLVYKSAFSQCHLYDCMTVGALAGVAVFVPLGLIITIISCGLMDGCSPLAWGPGMVFMTITGAILGASLGSYRGTSRLEQYEEVYIDGLNHGNKLIVVPTDSAESATYAASVMEQEHATAVKILDA